MSHGFPHPSLDTVACDGIADTSADREREPALGFLAGELAHDKPAIAR
jgi:hypothetical protein